MSVKPVRYWLVECDEPGCGTCTGDTGGEFTAWSDHGAAADDWTSSGGIILDDGRAFCEEHSDGKRCDNCDYEGTDLVKVDGEMVCRECAAAEDTP